MKPTIYPGERHGISRSSIDPDALSIMYRLHRSNFKAYLVGGGVRDLLLGKAPKDYDIATDALPEQMRRLFRNSRVIGRRFKIVHVYFPGNKNIEVATFRAATESRDDETATLADDNTYGTPETDAVRRDLTINALFYDIGTLSVIDYVGGMRDLMSGQIRIIGDPWERFREDPVRMIRAARQAARCAFELDPACEEAIRELYSLLELAPKSRIYDEFTKDLVAGALEIFLPLLIGTNLAEFLLPGLLQNADALFAPQSPFRLAIRRLDGEVKAGRELSVTDSFTVLLLGLENPTLDLEQIADDFPDDDAVYAALDRVFKAVAITRKEKDRITERVSAVSHLVSALAEDHQLSKRLLNRLPQIKRLLDFIAPDSELLRRVEIMEKESGAPTGQHRSSSRNGRRRRGRGRPPAHAHGI